MHFTDDTRDASDDAAVLANHDEDGDGLDDAIDPCPHIFGDASDADEDGVGDACDPDPQVGNEKWIAFYPMTPGTSPLVGDPAFPVAEEADDIRYTHDFGQGFDITVPNVSLRFEEGFEILGLVGTGQHVISSGIDGAGKPYYFAELDRNDPSLGAHVVSYDATNGYVTLSDKPMPAFHTGTGHFRYDAITGSAPRYTTEMGWDGELYAPAASTPGFLGGTDLKIVYAGMDIRIRYIALIQTADN
ncbi:MAG TPA: hypothetical protein VGM39_20175 [Kofleriaceae bacterium]